MTKKLLVFGWLTAAMAAVLMVSDQLAVGQQQSNCMKPGPEDDPCPECKSAWFFGLWKHWKCTSAVSPSTCSEDTTDDGWVCTETSNDCPGTTIWYSDGECEELLEVSELECYTNYWTAMAVDQGNEPECDP